MPRRRSNGPSPENLVKAVIGLFVMLALLLSGGDIRKFPAALGLLLKLLFWGIGVAVVGGIIWLILRRGKRAAAAAAGILPVQPQSLIPAPTVSSAFEKIDWYQFEKVVAKLLDLEGNTVDRRGGSTNDGGVDIIATNPTTGETVLVQCKFWKSWDLNLRSIRELLGARESAEFKARHAVAAIYTLSDPTRLASAFAQENNIRIVRRSEIETRLNKFSLNLFPELANPLEKRCPKCDALMVNRGKFWGCSTYGRTRCRGTIQIES